MDVERRCRCETKCDFAQEFKSYDFACHFGLEKMQNISFRDALPPLEFPPGFSGAAVASSQAGEAWWACSRQLSAALCLAKGRESAFFKNGKWCNCRRVGVVGLARGFFVALLWQMVTLYDLDGSDEDLTFA